MQTTTRNRQSEPENSDVKRVRGPTLEAKPASIDRLAVPRGRSHRPMETSTHHCGCTPCFCAIHFLLLSTYDGALASGGNVDDHCLVAFVVVRKLVLQLGRILTWNIRSCRFLAFDCRFEKSVPFNLS